MLEPFMRQVLRGVRFDRGGWRPVVARHYSLRPHDVTGIAARGDALGGTPELSGNRKTRMDRPPGRA